jgi:hypothetical protein
MLAASCHLHPYLCDRGYFIYLLPLFLLLIVWSVVWKGWALWRAARSGSKAWFIVFLLVNTAGILEIIYLFAISNKSVAIVPEIKTK